MPKLPSNRLLNPTTRSIIRISILLAILIAFSGCAYFNAFYNVKHYYSEAEKERERSTDMNSKASGYNKAVESGAVLLEYYPNSKYIDDALFLMGQCYYWMEEYHKAKRKFEELIANYPDSPFYQEGRLWLGKTLVKLKNRQEATASLRGLMVDTDDPEITSEALFALAELYVIDSLFVRAEEEFVAITETTKDPKVKGEAYWRAGESAFREQRYAEAEEYFGMALKYELPRALRYRVNIFYGRALFENRNYEESREVFQDLLRDKRYFEQHGEIRVYLAIIQYRLGDPEEALDELQRVIDNHSRSDEASRAYFEMGMIHLMTPGERDLAKEKLDKATTEKAGSFYAKTADSLLTSLNDVDDLAHKRIIVKKRLDFTSMWLGNPIDPQDTLNFTQADYYDSLAIDSLKLNILWARAYRDSIPVSSVPEPAPETEPEQAPKQQLEPGAGEEPPRLERDLFRLPEPGEGGGRHRGEHHGPGEGFEPGLPGMSDSTSMWRERGVEPLLADSVAPPIHETDFSLAIEHQAEDSVSVELPGDISLPDTAVTSATDSLHVLNDQEQDSLLILPGEEQPADSIVVVAEQAEEVELDSASLKTDSTIQQERSELVIEAPEEVEPEPVPEPIRLFDPTPVQDSLAQMRFELQDLRFQLGEILLFNLRQPDSAEVVFQELLVGQNADTVRARAYAALAYIAEYDSSYDKRDSIQTLLANDFADTRIGLEAAQSLGREIPPRPLSSDEEAFLEAEAMFLDDSMNVSDVYSKYRWVAETYPESPFAPRSLYAAAYLAGWEMDDPETAGEILDDIQQRYPSSEQAMMAGQQLNALDLYNSGGVDSLALQPSDAELEAYEEEAVDPPPDLFGGTEALANLLEARNLLPPEVISGTGGEVLLWYVISADGHAGDFRVVLEDPPGRGLARALIAGLEQSEFAPGRIDNEPVDVRVQRRYTLPLDAPPNIRPLPRSRR